MTDAEPAMKRLLAGLFLLAQIAQAQPVRITGRIVQPVSGAVGSTVELRPFMEDQAESLRQLAGEAAPPSSAPRARR